MTKSKPPRSGRAIVRSALLATLIATTAIAGAAQASVSKQQVARQLLKLSPAEIAERVEVRDDPLEDYVLFSTRPVLRKGGVSDGVSIHDGFLKAKRSRDGTSTVWRISYDMTFFGARRDPTLVHLRSKDGLLKIPPSTIRRWNDECGDGNVTCGQHMTVEFDLPEDAIREIAAAYQPGDPTPWLVRFKDANGQDVTVGIAPGEVAGLLVAVERWRG